MGDTKKHISSAHSLADVLHFSPDDLEHNRDGILSPAQAQRFQGEVGWRKVAMICITVGIACVVLFTSYENLGKRGVLFNDAGFLLLMSAIEMIALVAIGLPITEFRKDAVSQQINSVQGHVALDIANGRNGPIYSLNISGQHFKIEKDCFLAFKNDEPYAVYYAPHSRKLLSAEWLREPNAHV